MFRYLILGLNWIFLCACSSSYLGQGFDSNNSPPHLIHHQNDDKGQKSMPKRWQSGGLRTFVYNPKATAWAVYNENGKRIKTGRGSGGKHWCEDIGEPCYTVTGRFNIYKKQGLDCQSNKYPIETNGGAAMPYCQHFHQGFALHGSDYVPDYNASHGCIRVLPSAAKWLYGYLKVGSQVVVQSY